MTDICDKCGAKKRKDTRSDKQNRLYHMWIKIISDKSGYKPWELRSAFKDTFLPSILGEPEINRITKEKQEQNTTMCSPKQMTEYLNEIEMAANSEFDVELPHPEDLYYQAMGYTKQQPSKG